MPHLAVVLAAAVAWAGCSSRVPTEPAFRTLTTTEQPAPPIYRLQPGDELTIKFYTNPELNEKVVVRPDGMITLQLIDDVTAGGLTPTELDAELTRRYAGELANPEISVIVKTAIGQQVYVGGEVGTQGLHKYTAGLTLYQAIQQAGGFLKTAHRRNVVLIRRGPDGRPTGRLIDVRPIQRGEQPEIDIPLQVSDIVFVPRSKIANVNVFVEMWLRNNFPVQPILPAF